MDATAGRLATWDTLCNVGKIQQPAGGQTASGLVSSGEQTRPLYALGCAVADNHSAVWYEAVPFLTRGFCVAVSIAGRERDITVLSRVASRGTQDYAAAEKDVCDDVGVAFAAVIRAAEMAHGVSINELRITMLDDGSSERWVRAVCTITR
jgi:hypothetical protein